MSGYWNANIRVALWSERTSICVVLALGCLQTTKVLVIHSNSNSETGNTRQWRVCTRHIQRPSFNPKKDNNRHFIHNGGIGDIHISYTFLDPFFNSSRIHSNQENRTLVDILILSFRINMCSYSQHKTCKKPAQTGKAQLSLQMRSGLKQKLSISQPTDSVIQQLYSIGKQIHWHL